MKLYIFILINILTIFTCDSKFTTSQDLNTNNGGTASLGVQYNSNDGRSNIGVQKINTLNGDSSIGVSASHRLNDDRTTISGSHTRTTNNFGGIQHTTTANFNSRGNGRTNFNMGATHTSNNYGQHNTQFNTGFSKKFNNGGSGHIQMTGDNNGPSFSMGYKQEL